MKINRSSVAHKARASWKHGGFPFGFIALLMCWYVWFMHSILIDFEFVNSWRCKQDGTRGFAYKRNLKQHGKLITVVVEMFTGTIFERYERWKRVFLFIVRFQVQLATVNSWKIINFTSTVINCSDKGYPMLISRRKSDKAK